VKDGRPLGLISLSDLRLFETLDGIDPENVPVEDVIQRSVFSVAPKAALDDVVREMAKRKHDSALVVDNSGVIGIFTTVDALTALDELLHSRLSH